VASRQLHAVRQQSGCDCSFAAAGSAGPGQSGFTATAGPGQTVTNP
jgi:hypothetical protein